MAENKLTSPEQARSAYYADTKYGAAEKQRRRSRTSARLIKVKQRRAEALNYRLAGHSYRAIGAQMHLHPSSVHRHVLTAMAEIVPKDKVEALLSLELQRLDQLQSAFFIDAANGDTAAAEMVLRIMAHRARLVFPQQYHGGTHFNLNIGDSGPDAQDVGIRVEFVPSSQRAREEAEKYLGPRPGDGSKLINGPGSSWQGPGPDWKP